MRQKILTVLMSGLFCCSLAGCSDPPIEPANTPMPDAMTGLPPLSNGSMSDMGGPSALGNSPSRSMAGPMMPSTGGSGAMNPGEPAPRVPHCDRSQEEDCDNVDNDCDERVDEDCLCMVSEKPCYPGHPDDLNAPNTACRSGTQACILETYGECTDFVLPSPETCDGIDNDCNGVVDDASAGCAPNAPPVALCPAAQFGFPLSNFDVRGAYDDADGDPMERAAWRLTSAPPGSTANPLPAIGLDTRIFADLEGAYRLELEVEDSRGGIGRCQTEVSTDSRDGLRVEMVWNVNAVNDTSDVDLHLKKSTNARWFDNGDRGDDCFYMNCKVCESLNEEECRESIAEFNANPNAPPPPQVEWTAPLDNDDPRLDLDDVEGQGPENLNINSPRDGTYRLGVHYYDDHGFGPSTVSVRIFCDGGVVEQFGPRVLQDVGRSGGASTEFWEVADIQWSNGTCRVIPLGTPNCPRICETLQAESSGCPSGQTRGTVCR